MGQPQKKHWGNTDADAAAAGHRRSTDSDGRATEETQGNTDVDAAGHGRNRGETRTLTGGAREKHQGKRRGNTATEETLKASATVAMLPLR
jgi:hypothetical protein